MRIMRDYLNLWPWSNSKRPKTFEDSLKKLMQSTKYTLSERSLAIAAGVTRITVMDWVNGNSIPSTFEVKAISRAFCLNRFGRVTITECDRIFKELEFIANIERRINRSQK